MPATRATAFHRAAVLGLLLVHLALGLGQMRHTAPTFDEGFYIARGWAWWRTGDLMPLGHPAFASQLAGLPLLGEPGLPDPANLPGWASDQSDDFSNALLWQAAPNTDRLVWLARLPFLLLSLLLAGLTYRWARERFGMWAGLLALSLHALSPNLLANAPLAATDLPVAVFFVAALYSYRKALANPRWQWVVLAGVMLGLAQASKFSALLLGPILLLLTLPHWRRWWVGALTVVVALLGLWATYGFAVSPYPLAQYFAELAHLFNLADSGHFAYLFGELSLDGWWYYHPAVLLVKTPLVVLALLTASLGAALVQRNWHADDTWLALAALLFVGATMLTSLNVGYRYLLPVLPLLHVYAAGVVRWLPTLRARAAVLAATLLASALALVPVAPDYLPYFNVLVGGPRNGWRVLADSNIDWGQGLPLLAEAVGDDPIYLSYFGQADPTHYGLNSTPIPGWPPPDDAPPFYPANPAPGRYAISASNRVGVQLYQPNALAYFRDRPAAAVVDNHFFLFDVAARAPGRWLHQCNPALLDDEAVTALVGVAGLTGGGMDCASALLLGDGPGWLLVGGAQTAPVVLPAPDYVWRRADGTTFYTLHYLPDGWLPPIAAEEALFGDALRLVGHSASVDGSRVTVTAVWQVDALLPPPVSIFAHVLAPDGSFVAAGDALGVPAEQWQVGQRIVQTHTIDLPAGTTAVAGTRIALGVYRLDDNSRYRRADGSDALFITPSLVLD